MTNFNSSIVIETTFTPDAGYSWKCLHTAIQDFATKNLAVGAAVEKIYRQPNGDWIVVYTLNKNGIMIGTDSVRQLDAG